MPANKTSGDPLSNEYLLIGILVAMLLGAFGAVWAVASNIIGPVYRWVRTVESLGLWLLSDWGRYFSIVPPGQYSFSSIYMSSIPFGVFFAAAIFFMGLYARAKAQEEHINAFVKSRKPQGYRDIMRKNAILFPANQFFLDHDLAEMPLDRGVARMPRTALEFLTDANAIAGIYDDLEKTPRSGFVVDRDKVRAALAAPFGSPNTFLSRHAFADVQRIKEEADRLPWHAAVIAAPCLARIHAMAVQSEKDFAQTLIDSDEFMKSIWRELNLMRRELGDALVLGFKDDDDKAFLTARFNEGRKGGRRRGRSDRLWTLKEYLDEPIPGATCRADTLKAVKDARSKIVDVLTDHLSDTKTHLPAGLDDAGRLVRKPKGSLSASEMAFLRRHQAKQVAAAEALRTLLTKNGFLFGLLGTLLTETRRAGIFPPAVFRWMRFSDYPLWSFLRCVGMNAPVPESAGMFEHFQTETILSRALEQPMIENSITAVTYEADKYLTDEVRTRFKVFEFSRSAHQKTGSVRPQLAEALSALRSRTASLQLPDQDAADA